MSAACERNAQRTTARSGALPAVLRRCFYVPELGGVPVQHPACEVIAARPQVRLLYELAIRRLRQSGGRSWSATGGMRSWLLLL